MVIKLDKRKNLFLNARQQLISNISILLCFNTKLVCFILRILFPITINFFKQKVKIYRFYIPVQIHLSNMLNKPLSNSMYSTGIPHVRQVQEYSSIQYDPQTCYPTHRQFVKQPQTKPRVSYLQRKTVMNGKICKYHNFSPCRSLIYNIFFLLRQPNIKYITH